MCEFGRVERLSLPGSGRSAQQGWFSLERVQVYHDHFIKAEVPEGIVIDVLNKPGEEGLVRLCLELDFSSAQELARAIMAIVDEVEARAGSGRVDSVAISRA